MLGCVPLWRLADELLLQDIDIETLSAKQTILKYIDRVNREISAFNNLKTVLHCLPVELVETIWHIVDNSHAQDVLAFVSKPSNRLNYLSRIGIMHNINVFQPDYFRDWCICTNKNEQYF